jgi:DNA-binding GntR family transcriptional regulator
MRLTDDAQGKLCRIQRELLSYLEEDLVHEAVPLDLAFHEQIWETADNRYMANLARSFYEAFHDARRSFFSAVPRIRADAVAEHETILEALLSRDPEGAYAAMRVHIRNFRHSIGAVIERPDEGQSLKEGT